MASFSSNIHSGVPVSAPHGSNYRASSSSNGSGSMPTVLSEKPDFDIFAWHASYLSCQQYFLDRSQHELMVQSVANLMNIRLPFQWAQNPVMSSNRYSPTGAPSPGQYGAPYNRHHASPSQAPRGTPWVSLVPFIRRLIATGFDTEGILHGFFGDEWRQGIGELQECERRNFLFTAKSVGWAKVKYQYDMLPDETIPFIKPLQNVKIEEIENAEKEWSKWLAMEDWMVGPLDPDRSMAEGRGNPI